jgi:hypothetical protein
MKKLAPFIVIFLFAACEKDKEIAKTSGEVILSSQIKGNASSYYVEGFLLEQAKTISFNITSSPVPDLVLENIVDLQGNVVGANLTSPQNDAAFYKAGEFVSLAEAEAFYNNLTDAGSHIYNPTADAIAANQVYIFQSRGNKFAKLLIKSYKIVPSASSDFVEINLKWSYQPSGEKAFSK